MYLATAKEIRNIDRRAIVEFGIPGPVLMENAAAALMREMDLFFTGLSGKKIGIICGKGNNGGDGLALARRLRIRGIPVKVALLASYGSIRGEAGIHLSVLRKTDADIAENASSRVISAVIAWSDILVDAMLGVGLSSSVKGLYSGTIKGMNESGKPIVAVDIPTGINADTGEIMGSAIRADLTVTMVCPKRGLLLYPGAECAGAVRVADIGIPVEAIEKEKISVRVLDESSVSGLLRKRAPDAHKGNFGHLLLVAGSPGKAGAAAMAARGALRTGAGLVTIAAPNGLVPIIQSGLAEAMCFPAAESIDGTLGMGSEEELLKTAESMSACAIGPGLSIHYETVQSVRNLVKRLLIPTVIDADGLNALAGDADVFKKAKATLILTPHPGEMARLVRLSSHEIQKDRIGVASAFAGKNRVIVVLKGAGTVVALPGGDIFVNTTGNPGMATGGTGDVLTGMIGALLAQGYTAEAAVCLGVYLHGLAGDLAAAEKGESGMIAGDVIEHIPHAIKIIGGYRRERAKAWEIRDHGKKGAVNADSE